MMESAACQEMTTCPAEEPAAAAIRPRQQAAAFQFDNLRDRVERPRRLVPRAAIAVPAYSRIVYRAGAVTVR
jgi:hypothetical protein